MAEVIQIELIIFVEEVKEVFEAFCFYAEVACGFYELCEFFGFELVERGGVEQIVLF